ncbi:hypothetical protein [Jatrophihabitans sp. GAS493]|uniref:hypothetical protein n=1 Tax=Jatrophihabitans sp. GAS493 TaxID=1907575 RepID=UPI0015619821|nr:hypothetical protein [Jatrophihabitans sp. GAS493]
MISFDTLRSAGSRRRGTVGVGGSVGAVDGYADRYGVATGQAGQPRQLRPHPVITGSVRGGGSAEVDLAVSLLRSITDGTDVLSRLTGLPFADGHEPDFLAVRRGPNVPGVLPGGFTTTGWTDAAGNTVTWFAAGRQPHAYQGVTVLYADGSTRDDHAHLCRVALEGLSRHLQVASRPRARNVHPLKPSLTPA